MFCVQFICGCCYCKSAEFFLYRILFCSFVFWDEDYSEISEEFLKCRVCLCDFRGLEPLQQEVEGGGLFPPWRTESSGLPQRGLPLLIGGLSTGGRLTSSMIRQQQDRGNGIKLKEEKFRPDIKRKFFIQSGEVLGEAVQRSSGCSVCAGVQGQAGWGWSA